MPLNHNTVQTGVLEQLTLPELIDIWAEDEIYRRLQEVELFSRTIVREARRLENLHVVPLRGGSCDEDNAIEVMLRARQKPSARF